MIEVIYKLLALWICNFLNLLKQIAVISKDRRLSGTFIPIFLFELRTRTFEVDIA